MRWCRGWLIHLEGSEQPQGEKRGWSSFWVVCPGGWGLSRGGWERLLSVLPQTGPRAWGGLGYQISGFGPWHPASPVNHPALLLQVWLTCLLWQLL